MSILLFSLFLMIGVPIIVARWWIGLTDEQRDIFFGDEP